MTTSIRILCISGPNLKLLGTREPDIYGRETLNDIHKRLKKRAVELDAIVDAKQTDREGEIVEWIGAAPKKYAGLLLNAAAYTHTSLAIFDALKATGIACVEVHLSNPEAREAYRHESRVAPACIGKVSGFRGDSYVLALEGLVAHLRRSQ
ncbi:MAG TPA: type II 3-dehydroquinate dehydratase [Polyangiaceae bacterium]|nr:type II 3-dehydroquinate dehydratase [Polyangiaceae bacterium]